MNIQALIEQISPLHLKEYFNDIGFKNQDVNYSNSTESQ